MTNETSIDQRSPEAPPPHPTAPPTIPGVIQLPPRARAPVWPTVIGIIALVFGSAGILQSGAGLLMPLFSRMFRNLPTAPGQGNPFSAMDRYMTPLVALYIVGAVIAVLLIIGGAALIQRRAWAGRAIAAWAVAKLVWGLVISVVTGLMQKAQMDDLAAQMAASGSAAAAPMMGAMPTFMMVFGVVFGLVWYAALPVFMLIWFRRGAVKREVAGWDGRG